MSKEDRFEMNGTIVQKLKGDRFIVKLENGLECTGTVSGKLRINAIRLVVGDSVIVDLSPYSIDNCRIIWRYKSNTESNSNA